jgi:hypothetical protein
MSLRQRAEWHLLAARLASPSPPTTQRTGWTDDDAARPTPAGIISADASPETPRSPQVIYRGGCCRTSWAANAAA